MTDEVKVSISVTLSFVLYLSSLQANKINRLPARPFNSPTKQSIHKNSKQKTILPWYHDKNNVFGLLKFSQKLQTTFSLQSVIRFYYQDSQFYSINYYFIYKKTLYTKKYLTMPWELLHFKKWSHVGV